MARAKAPKPLPRGDAPELLALEARLADDPEDIDSWLVYADALQNHGAVHGELIALQIAADKDPVGKKTPARATFVRAFAKHAPGLLAELTKVGVSIKDPYAAPLIWRTGVPRRLVLGGSQVAPRLAAILPHPAARLLGELELRLGSEQDVLATFAALAAHPPPLHELEIVANTWLNDPRMIWKTFPRLRRLTLVGNRLEVEGIELPEARRVSLQSLELSAAAMQAIAAAPWPVVERLDVRVGFLGGTLSFGVDAPSEIRAALERDDDRVAATFEDIAPLLRRTDLPALTHLRIRKAPFAGAILRALAEQPLGRQLQVLDLSQGTMTPQDIKFAADRKTNFANLKELWIPALDQWSGVAQAAAGLATHVITRPSPDVLQPTAR